MWTLPHSTAMPPLKMMAPNVLGTAAIIGTAAVGTAVLGYQAYSLGTEFAGKLMALPVGLPQQPQRPCHDCCGRMQASPCPNPNVLYPDVEQEEQDMDLQHAARWAMENELIPDLNDEGTAPEADEVLPGQSRKQARCAECMAEGTGAQEQLTPSPNIPKYT